MKTIVFREVQEGYIDISDEDYEKLKNCNRQEMERMMNDLVYDSYDNDPIMDMIYEDKHDGSLNGKVYYVAPWMQNDDGSPKEEVLKNTL